MSEQQTYIPYTRDDLIKKVGFVAANLASKLHAFADEKGAICVSFSTLSELWGVDERVIKKAAATLSALDIWWHEKGDGRGHVTVWKKGANYATFVTLKRVHNLQIKGAKNAPYNKDNNKDRLISAHTRVKSINQKEGLTINPEVMEKFEQFWQAFFFGKYSKYEKEQSAYKVRAQAVWQYLPVDKRERLLIEIKAGKRWDNTHYVLWYLQNYNPLPPVWFNGDAELTPEMVSKMYLIKYNGRTAYCRPTDLKTLLDNGAKLFK